MIFNLHILIFELLILAKVDLLWINLSLRKSWIPWSRLFVGILISKGLLLQPIPLFPLLLKFLISLLFFSLNGLSTSLEDTSLAAL